MLKAILAEKIKMSQIFDKEGNVIPVTVLAAGPCFVSAIKTKEKDGYNAVQIGYKEAKKIKKPQEGHLKKLKAQSSKLKKLREFRIDDQELLNNIKLGDEINTSVFKEGDNVKISGISKGKGFAGVIKRHGFRRGPETHGSDHHRKPGSIGSMFPQRVVKGRKMPGHAGVERITIRSAKIVKVISETNTLLIKGAVPGSNKSLVEISGIE